MHESEPIRTRSGPLYRPTLLLRYIVPLFLLVAVPGLGLSAQEREIQPVPDRPEIDLREEIRREVRAAMGADRSIPGTAVQMRYNGWSAPGNIVRGLALLFQTLVSFAILFGMGLALLHFFPRNFEVVARTAQNATGRSALVGLASGILFGPLWIVGIVVLIITIVGIPALLIWIPMFPLAFALAMTLGLLAVARNLGRWTTDQHTQGFVSLDGSRPAVQLAAGLAILLSAFALAAVFQMGGAWLFFFHGLLAFLGVLLVATAACVGLGATILSRGGRDLLYAGTGWSWDGGTDPRAPTPDPFDPEPGPHDPEPGPRRGGRPG